jgi:serine/threonine protein kinase/tetratricopeptide (TPR) repeat protein
MGVTYRAIDTSLQRKVALKIIKVGTGRGSAEARERFLREARAAAALRHENIATVYQFGIREDTGQYFYAMELIDGETLEERVRRAGPLSVRITIDIAQQINAALAVAEKHGLVHRDLKPANVMLVSPDNETAGADANNEKVVIKIIDFGLAKALHAPADPMSLTRGRFVGTPEFASPEQFEHCPLDVRSDIYSLGATLWFALTGHTPFVGHKVEEVHRAQQSDVLPIEELKAARVPSVLRSLVESMLALEPASRPGTHELAAQLQRCSPEARRALRINVALTSVAILVLGASLFFIFVSLRTQNPVLNPEVAEKSLAVLPFESLSEEKANEFFADGVQDEILTNLSRIADLTVISRTSTMHYKSGVGRNLREIGQQLGVANVVEGSVQRAGNRVRVNAQLVDARTDQHLWAQTYDRDLTDVFAIQSDLAQKITEALKARLSPQEKARMQHKPTENSEAYLSYVLAHNLSRTFEDFDKLKQGEQLYARAIELDPNFALAFAGYSQLESWILHTFDATPEHREKAQTLAERALQLQPGLPEAHLARGFSYYYGDNNYDAALKEFVIAQSGLPNESQAYLSIGAIQRRQGKWAESTANLEKAVSLNPKDIWSLQNLTFNYQMQRDFDRANRTIDRALALNATFPELLEVKSKLAIFQKGEFSVAEKAFEAMKSVPLTNAQKLTVGSARAEVFLLERKYKEGLQQADSLPDDQLAVFPGALWSKYYCIGFARKALQDESGARVAFLRAKSAAEDEMKQNPEAGAELRIQLAKTLAYLGEKNSALAEAQRASELLPESKDAFSGPDITEGVAQVHAILGESDRAIEILDGLLRRPSGVTVPFLKVNPIWDPLRSNHAFQKLCEEKQ